MAKIKIWVRTFDAKLCFSLDSETLYSDTTEKNPSIFCFMFLYVLNFNANFFFSRVSCMIKAQPFIKNAKNADLAKCNKNGQFLNDSKQGATKFFSL